VAGQAGGGAGGDTVPTGRQPRRDMPLPGPRRGQVPGAGPQLRSATVLGEQSPGERARVADLRRR
jgi:hypothetical protein